MPGLIGASMFSPRPARGYRFHSLQVEIMARSSNRSATAKKPTVLSNYRLYSVHLRRNSRRLQLKSWPVSIVDKYTWRAARTTFWPANPPQKWPYGLSARGCRRAARQVSPCGAAHAGAITRSRLTRQSAARAFRVPCERFPAGGRLPTSKNKLEEPHAKQI